MKKIYKISINFFYFFKSPEKVVEVNEFNRAKFEFEAKTLLCGEVTIEDLQYCELDERMEITKDGVRTKLMVFSSFSLAETEETINKNVEAQLMKKKIHFELIDLEHIESGLVELSKILPRDFAKFTTGEIVMISVFTVVG